MSLVKDIKVYHAFRIDRLDKFEANIEKTKKTRTNKRNFENNGDVVVDITAY